MFIQSITQDDKCEVLIIETRRDRFVLQGDYPRLSKGLEELKLHHRHRLLLIFRELRSGNYGNTELLKLSR